MRVWAIIVRNVECRKREQRTENREQGTETREQPVWLKGDWIYPWERFRLPLGHRVPRNRKVLGAPVAAIALPYALG